MSFIKVLKTKMYEWTGWMNVSFLCERQIKNQATGSINQCLHVSIALVKEADSDRWLEYNRWVLLQLVESAGSWWRCVTSTMNRHSSIMRVIMEVLLLSQELVDMGNGAHTSQSWTGETHSWRSLETQTME